jgi:hypothetical protein
MGSSGWTKGRCWMTSSTGGNVLLRIAAVTQMPLAVTVGPMQAQEAHVRRLQRQHVVEQTTAAELPEETAEPFETRRL